MASIPRTSTQILADFQTAAALSDPSADTAKGPLYSLVGVPLSTVLAPIEAEVADLQQIYSAEFAQTADSEDAQAFLTNWGESLGAGTPATVPVYFMTFTAPTPGNDISVPVGALVGNSDQSLQFITTEAGTIVGDNAAAFYNPSRRTYEIMLLCQAVANGSQYNLPAGRVIVAISDLPGIDAVENRVDCTPGSLAETQVQGIQRVQQKFLGLAINTPQGVKSAITTYAPTSVFDVQTITSSNRSLFKRLVYGPAMDCYVSGSVPATVQQSYTAVGGETVIAIPTVPALSINSVTINQVPITNFSLSIDTSVQFQLSADANDLLVLGITLQAGDVVSYSVTYNSLIQGIQNNVFSATKLFETDQLAREFLPVPLVISMTGRAIANYDPVTVQNNILQELDNLILNVWTESYYPQDFFNAVKENVLGLSNLQLVTFQRSSQSTSQVEIVLMNQNELATYDPDYVSVQITSV